LIVETAWSGSIRKELEKLGWEETHPRVKRFLKRFEVGAIWQLRPDLQWRLLQRLRSVSIERMHAEVGYKTPSERKEMD